MRFAFLYTLAEKGADYVRLKRCQQLFKALAWPFLTLPQSTGCLRVRHIFWIALSIVIVDATLQTLEVNPI